MRLHRLALALAASLLVACSGPSEPTRAYESIVAGPLHIAVEGEGELQSTQATPLLVPGRQWSPRQLAWTVPDGSVVKKGEVVARFSATQSEQSLKLALIDLERNLLAKAGKRAELASTQGQLGVDISDVATQLGIARRYANAGLEALSRNKVLDAVQDEQFLDTKQGILDWRRDQSSTRGKAEMAVLDAQRATMEINAKQKRADLDALELRAPNDGIFMLEADWRGNKPQIGSSQWAGNQIASLPDTHSMEVLLAVPQLEAQGIKPGDTVRLHPLGQSAETVTSKLSWVAQAAQPRDSDSPVKYLSMKAPVPAAAIAKYGWVPGQRFVGEVVLLDRQQAISVPNLAIDSSGDGANVRVKGDAAPRPITLGVRGAARSEVLHGLEPGERVLLDDKQRSGT
ncbi:MAG TPA: hypothetical protein VFN09_02705 [Rhodanobacteraceae bacterium]|nr:hypothetical protein [Rhodanobacteraceae bacterium]